MKTLLIKLGLLQKVETNEEFLADVARLNEQHRQASYKANARMQNKYEDMWYSQFAIERKSL